MINDLGDMQDDIWHIKKVIKKDLNMKSIQTKCKENKKTQRTLRYMKTDYDVGL